jgi:peptidyl-prolyl cis-trans isomerase D
MLNVMRKYAGSWMIKVILTAIVIVFVFWGVGSFKSRKDTQVANVNGEVITIEEYQKAYNNIVENYRRQYGSRVNEQMLEQLQLGRQTVDQLVNKKLLLQESGKLGFQVTDEELSEQIMTNPAFLNGGTFNKRQYDLLLRQNRLSPEEFEHSMRQQMIIEKLQNFISLRTKISEDEVWNWYAHENQTVNIEYVMIKPDIYKDINLTNEEIKTYFDANKETYRTDPTVKVQYLYFDPKNFAGQTTVSDQETREYYEAHPDEFHQEKAIEARHILFKIDQDADEKDVQEAKQKALKVLKSAQEGKDFAELAKTYSEGPSKDSGGHLGTFTRDKMVKPFSDAAFALKAGEISDLVRTQFGWHIIKVEKVNPERTEPLKEVQPKIRAKLINMHSKSAAYDRAEEIYDLLFNGEDISKVADDQGLSVKKSDFFTSKGPEKGINNPTQFATAAFELEVMDISEVKEISGGYYIIQPIEKIASKIPPLEDVVEQVKKDLTVKLQEEQAEKNAKSIIEALKKNDNFTAAAKPFKLSVKETGFFKRNETIPQIGYEPAISSAAFDLNDKNKFSKLPHKGSKGVYVISLKERREANAKEFEAQKKQIQERLLQQKKYSNFNDYLAELKKRSQIMVQDKFIQ